MVGRARRRVVERALRLVLTLSFLLGPSHLDTLARLLAARRDRGEPSLFLVALGALDRALFRRCYALGHDDASTATVGVGRFVSPAAGTRERAEDPSVSAGSRTKTEVEGLFYFRARYLDPVEGRFVSREPAGIWGDPSQLGNPYSFCGGDPVNGVDPSGLLPSGARLTTEEGGFWSPRRLEDARTSELENYQAASDRGDEAGMKAAEGELDQIEGAIRLRRSKGETGFRDRRAEIDAERRQEAGPSPATVGVTTFVTDFFFGWAQRTGEGVKASRALAASGDTTGAVLVGGTTIIHGAANVALMLVPFLPSTRATTRTLTGANEYLVADPRRVLGAADRLVALYERVLGKLQIRQVPGMEGATIDTVTGRISIAAEIAERYPHLWQGYIMEELLHFEQLVQRGILGRRISAAEFAALEKEVVQRVLDCGFKVFDPRRR